MNDRDVMQQALEALKKATKHLPVHFDSHFEAITALRTKLEQSDMGIPITEKQAEPVATVQCINGITIGYIEVMQPVGTKLYTAPPQRKPLTNDEIALLYMSHTDQPRKAYWEFARAIEAAHGIGEKP